MTNLDNLTEEERKEVLKILNQFSVNGESKSYNTLLYSDYEEIPVDIETFLKTPKFLGRGLIDDEGRFTVFPYWVEMLKKIYPDPLKPAKYNTLALTGSIGIGKSFVAVLIGLYELYRMMCLKDPYVYYGLQPIDKISFAVMNITLDASRGVAWDKMQQLLQSSEWFMEKGTVSGTVNEEWHPPKGIELIAGSLSRHIIGRAVFWCLDGDTEIATNLGDYKLSELVDKQIQVYNIDTNGNLCLSDYCTVKPTAIETEEYEIELEDGTIIKCTPSHRFMLSDGSYKEAQYLTEDDDILYFKPFGYVYKITNNINNHFYIGKRECSYFDEKYWGSGKRIKYEIDKYGINNFSREVLCWAKTRDELCELEEKYITQFFNLTECINLKQTAVGGNTTKDTIKITDGVNEKHICKTDIIPEGWHVGSKLKGMPKTEEAKLNMKKSWTEERRKKWSVRTSGEHNSQWGNNEAHKGAKNGRFGRPVSESTKKKISEANKGRKFSKEVNKKKGRPGVKKPDGFGEKIRKANLGTHWYNNGVIQRKYHDENVPYGWVRGVLK